MSITIAHRHYLSISHLSAASLFARDCQDLESDPATAAPGSAGRRRHTACAVSSVILSAAFLEATINELFSDCCDGHQTERIAALPAKDLMARLWKKGIPRRASYPILEKYDIALELNGKAPLELGRAPVQDVTLLVELRNALIHFEPETIVSYSEGEAVPHKLEKRFESRKITTNPLTGAGNPFYPDKLLGGGCARWAVAASVLFTDAFFQQLGIPAPYEHVRELYLQ